MIQSLNFHVSAADLTMMNLSRMTVLMRTTLIKKENMDVLAASFAAALKEA